MGGGKKRSSDASQDEDGFEVDMRTEGMDAHVFSQPIGYIPQFPAPPKYIRVRSVFDSMGRGAGADDLLCRFVRNTSQNANLTKPFSPKSSTGSMKRMGNRRTLAQLTYQWHH